MTFKKTFIALAAAAALSAPLSAQSSGQSNVFIPTDNQVVVVPPAGLVPFMPSPFSSLFFAIAFGGGWVQSVPNPGAAGAPVVLPPGIANAIGQLLSGNPTPEGRATAVTAFGGTAAASTLANAIVAMGANTNPQTAAAAVNAYNQAIDALPAGQTPGPGLLAARFALVGFAPPARR